MTVKENQNLSASSIGSFDSWSYQSFTLFISQNFDLRKQKKISIYKSATNQLCWMPISNLFDLFQFLANAEILIVIIDEYDFSDEFFRATFEYRDHSA